MTGLSDLVGTIICVGFVLLIALTLYLAPRFIRDRRRDRGIERAELTSEGLEERAVTTIHGGDFVRLK